jgi:septum formation protein
MAGPEIILASASPRRAALLEQIGLPFRVCPSVLGDDGEARFLGEAPSAYACRVALAKAREVADRLDRGLVIGADTVVVCRDRLFGKPRTREEAIAFLSSLAGRTHQVITGVAVLDAGTARFEVDAAETAVTMRTFGAAEAAQYVATDEPMDKAGAYGIQGRGALLVDGIHGDYFNVVGLPLGLLARLLRRFGIDPWEMTTGGSPAPSERRENGVVPTRES